MRLPGPRYLGVILALALCAPPQAAASAQPAPASADTLTRRSVLRAADLRADLAILRRAYETLHPGLHRYLTPAEVAAAFDETDRYFRTDRSLAASFLALTRLTARIKCGHSYPNFWNQPDRIATALFEGQDKLPFEFRWLDGRMIVQRDLRGSATPLPPGSEILGIDGVPARTILDSLLPLARADGGNDAKRIAYLEVRGVYRYHAFDVLYPLVFPVRGSGFTVRVRAPGGPARELQVTALSAAERRARGTRAVPLERDAPAWTVTEEQGLAVIRMPTWALFDSKWNARRWGDSILDDLIARGVPDLVLDLRGNEGGLSAGDAILARLIERPLELPRYDRYVSATRAPADLIPYLDTWDRSFNDWTPWVTDSVVRGGRKFWRMSRWDDTTGADVIPPASDAARFTGRLWVLVGAANSSATFQFALAVKRSGLGTLVGQPTGGNLRGINGSAFYFLRLPRTSLEVDLPLVAGFAPHEERDAGVEPDILVRPRAEDIATGRDAELEAVRAAIRERRRR